MSESNAPESVDLDEKYNRINPELLDSAVLYNLTTCIKGAGKQGAEIIVPLMLTKSLGIRLTEKDYLDIIKELMHLLTDCGDIATVIEELHPISEEDHEYLRSVGDDTEFGQMIINHPLVKKAISFVEESPEQKLARVKEEVRARRAAG